MKQNHTSDIYSKGTYRIASIYYMLINMSERISRKYNGFSMSIYLETVLDIIVAGLS